MTNEFRMSKFSSGHRLAATGGRCLPLYVFAAPIVRLHKRTTSSAVYCLLYSLAIARAITIHVQSVETMSPKLNKKQKKQIDAARKKISKLQQQLAGAKQQPDDPADVPRLESEIARLHDEIHKIQDD